MPSVVLILINIQNNDSIPFCVSHDMSGGLFYAFQQSFSTNKKTLFLLIINACNWIERFDCWKTEGNIVKGRVLDVSYTKTILNYIKLFNYSKNG